ncbi:hypothetical protein EON64_15705 [archaeon]|nr:MAG: hypothetical protein EON64_15705 [archaeon]
MTTDYCSRSLVVGQIIMNEEVTQSDDRVIEVYRGNEQLQSGASYTPGEALTVKISDAQKEYVFEAWGGATFTGGGCAGRRIANKPSAEIVMPTALPEEGQVKIAAAWAPGHVAVLLSRDFVLMPPSDPANLPANPPSNPPDHADPDETHKEEPVHDLLSDLQASIAQQEAQRLQQEREESARRELNKLAEETQEEEGAVAKPEGAQPLEQAEGSARSAAEKAAAAISAVRTVVHEKKAERKHWKMGEEELLAPPNTWRVKQQGQRQEGQPEEPVYRDILGEELERNRVGLRGGQGRY